MKAMAGQASRIARFCNRRRIRSKGRRPGAQRRRSGFFHARLNGKKSGKLPTNRDQPVTGSDF